MTPLEHAQAYIARGWNPVPVPFRTKGPQDKGWQTRIIDASTVHRHFNGAPANIGIVMGPSSAGLTDIDLDCPEAIDVAPYILPSTKAIFGRQSARASHWLYRTTLADTSSSAVFAFNDPELEAGNDSPTKARLVELRCGGRKASGDIVGCQTIAPGSVHETGEAIRWEHSADGEPSDQDGAELLAAVRVIAVAALLTRAWPPEGAKQRHDAALILGGFLARAKVAMPTIKLVAEAVVRASRDPEPKNRIDAAIYAAENYPAGERTKGFPALRDWIGDKRARRIAEWLSYDSTADEREPVAAPAAPASNAIKATPFTWRDPSQFPRREWLLGHDYCRRYLSGLIAPGASGKSGLMLAEALVLVTGRPLLGTAPRETIKVWYYGGEDPQEETERRVLAAMKHYGIAPEEVEGRLFLTSGRDVPISIADMADGRAKVATPVVEAIVAQMLEHEIGAMLVDPFVSTHGVGENDNVAINLVARQWGAIAERTNAAIGLAHHSSKPGGETVTTEKSRGASSLMDACRIGRAMNKMTKAQADELGVEEPNRFFRIGGADSAGKHNLAPPTDKTHWYRLASVCLENGKPVGGNAFENMAPDLSDWVGVVETWEPPSLMSHVDSVAQLEEIQLRATAGRWRKSQQSVDEPWIGLLVAEVLNLDASNQGHRSRIRKLLGVWLGTKALEVYEAKDGHGEVKPYVRGGRDDGGAS